MNYMSKSMLAVALIISAQVAVAAEPADVVKVDIVPAGNGVNVTIDPVKPASVQTLGDVQAGIDSLDNAKAANFSRFERLSAAIKSGKDTVVAQSQAMYNAAGTKVANGKEYIESTRAYKAAADAAAWTKETRPYKATADTTAKIYASALLHPRISAAIAAVAASGIGYAVYKKYFAQPKEEIEEVA